MVALYDELWSGIAVVGAPGVEDAQSIGHVGYALWIFAVPIVVAALIEAPLALWSDRVGRGRLLKIALIVLGSALVLCGVAARPWVLSLGLAIAGASSGVACTSAQAELVAAYAGRPERAMTRWTAFAAAGDALAPLIAGAALWAGGSYRGAMFVVAALVAAQALATACLPRPRPIGAEAPTSAPSDADACAESEAQARSASRQGRWAEVWALLAPALARPRLWLLMLGATCCLLLDEVVVALVALRMTRELGATEARTAAALTAYSLGSLAGALITDALVERTSARKVLALSAGLSAVALATVIAARSPAQALLALLVLGASDAPHYALLKAAAYDEASGRPGAVNAIAQLFFGLELALPLAVGFVAAHYGLAFALASLSLQPLVVLAAALWVLRAR